uniref:Uncharacterized protein n=1 Tax=viral metagenome TaxID=1070528 RepID=A0A6C0BPI6_9ZZZZ
MQAIPTQQFQPAVTQQSPGVTGVPIQATTVYVAPRQRRPTKIDWKTIERAQAKNQYIQVGKVNSKLSITGAETRWKKDPDFVYCRPFWLCGHPQDIATVITSLPNLQTGAPYTLEEATRYLNPPDTYSFNSTTRSAAEGGNRELFMQEIADAVQLKEERIVKAPVVTLADIPAILAVLPKNIGRAQAQIRRLTNATRGSGRSGGGRATLEQRVQAAADRGVIIDVSNITDELTNARQTTSLPGAGSSVVHVPGLAIGSNNEAKYAFALRVLGVPNAEAYLDEFRRIRRSRGLDTVGGVGAVPSTRLPTQQQQFQQFGTQQLPAMGLGAQQFQQQLPVVQAPQPQFQQQGLIGGTQIPQGMNYATLTQAPIMSQIPQGNIQATPLGGPGLAALGGQQFGTNQPFNTFGPNTLFQTGV